MRFFPDYMGIFRPFYIVGMALCIATSPGCIQKVLGQTLEEGVISSLATRVNTPLNDQTENYDKPVVPAFSNPESIVGDAGGINPWLRDQGIGIIFDNIDEYAQVLTSPPSGKNLHKGGTNAGQYGLQIDLDWDKIAGIPGFATHIVTTGRYGTFASANIGDTIAHSQEIYGGGGNVAMNLVMLYGEENLLGGRVSLAAGRMAQLSDFAASNLFCNFMNNSICGRPKAAGDNGYYSTYPGTEWAFRVRGRPTKDLYLQAGIYFAEKGIFPGPGNQTNRSGWRFSGSNIVGQIFPVEAGWEPSLDKEDTLPGHYKIGFSYEHAPRPDNLYDDQNIPYPTSGRSARMRHQSFSTWLMMDQRLTHYPETKTKDSGLTLLGGAIHNAPYNALRDYEFYAALINRGFITDRPYDSFGIAYTYVHIAASRRRAEMLLENSGQPYPSGATGQQKDSQILEASYSIHVSQGVVFAPDLQYYIHPNGQRNLKNSVLIGFKSHIVLF